MNFEAVIDDILAKEQGYVDHLSDRGGPTNWGITQAVARREGYTGPMHSMPVALARDIYRKRYISAPWFDRVSLINEKVGAELVDTGVNMGPGRAAEFLQRVLNVLNKGGSQYADLFVDGRIGNMTLDALRSFLRFRGDDGVTVLLRALNSQQCVKYIEFAEANESQEAFLYGWILNRVS